MKRSYASIFAAGLLVAGCGNTDTTMTGVTMAHGTEHQFVVSKLLLPMVKTDYAIDLNGDTHPDNQLGNIIGALSTLNFDTQKAIDDAVSKGSALLLVSVQTTDATLMTDDTVGVKMYLGKAMTNPDFSGAGMFMSDASQTPGQFFGHLKSGSFSSNNPVSATPATEVQITITLPLIAGAAPVALKLNGGHIQFTASTATHLVKGELHGSIKFTDIQTSIIPAVASLLSDRIKADDVGMACATNTDCKVTGNCLMAKCALTDAAKQIKGIFDVGDSAGGNCMNPDGTTGKPSDGKIDVCEVSGNSLVSGVLNPDVQIFDATGAYAPNAKNTMKDSLSLGLGFECVGAKFTP